ncbi:MAG: hypothetical protein CL663_08825 [Bacteroidetes bacterium]|nr:hypothetical protein [Bacteroidota bacterium]
MSGYTVNWTCDNSRLSFVSETDTTADFSIISTGEAYVDARIIAPNDRVLELNKFDVWIGLPAMPTTLPSGYPTVQLNQYQIFNVQIDSMPGCFNVDSVYWSSTGSIVEIASTTGSQCTFEAINSGIGNFYVQTENLCGLSLEGGGTVNVSGGGGGPLGPMLLVYPNPATESFEIQLDESIVSSDQETVESELRIYDQYFSLKEIKKFKGGKYKINTNRLKKGTYIIEVVNKNGKYSTKVIVDK